MEYSGFLFTFLVFLAAAVIVVPLCKKIGMGSVLGDLIAGSLVGPWCLKLVTNVEEIMHFAEFGVVLLLFIIGLELKPSRLWVMRKAVFGTGGFQVLVSTVLFFALARWAGLEWSPALAVGFTFSLSSTAFVLQILAEKNQLNTEYGRMSFAILLFQDIATIPVLAAIPLLGRGESGGLGTKALIAIATVMAIIVGGRFLLRPVFRVIADSRIKEIFTAAALLLVVGTAFLMTMIGLSMALGTFLAGVLLADSEYRHELEVDIDPFKGLLLGLFFMAVGMSLDFGIIVRQTQMILLLTIGLLAAKFTILYVVGRSSGLSNDAARNMAVALPQVGEFAFVLIGMLSAQQLLPKESADLLVVVVTLTMAATPLLYALNEKFICKQAHKPKEFDQIPNEHNPVIIAGFGRVGQIVARILRLQEIGFTALEHDSEQVEVVRRFGNKIHYGDASRLDLLRAAGADSAKVFVLAIDDIDASVRTAEMVRTHFPKLKILARARNRQHAYKLMDLGVELFHRETLGSSLWMARDLLRELGLNSEQAQKMIDKFLIHDEKMIREQHKVHHDETMLINVSKQAAQQLVEVFKADKI
jgi:monovalent cation:proton antiporter-2 (CPA2) family protein